MSRARMFREALGSLVDFDALSALEFALDAAQVLEDRALLLLPAPGVGLYVLDAGGRVRAVNNAGAARYGTTVRNLVGRRLWDFMSAEVGGFRRNIVALAMAMGCRFSYLDNLTDRWVDVHIEPLANDDAVLIRTVDITDGVEFRLNSGRVQFVALECRARTIE
jgi:PAS domain-containing protein